MVHPDEVSVESTSDFRLRQGDYVVRADNSRWRVNTPQRVTVRTGYPVDGMTEYPALP